MIERLLCTSLMLLGLGACNVPPTVSPPAASPPAASPSVSEGSCGDIVLTGNPPRPTSAKVAEQAKFCFLESLRACSPRALTVRETDKGTVRQFSIVKGERCILRQAFQASADTPPAVVDCAGARLENNALLVQGCSHLGDFVLTP